MITDVASLLNSRYQRGWHGMTGEGLGDDLMDLLNKWPTLQQTKVQATRTGVFGVDSRWGWWTPPSKANQSAKRQARNLRNLARMYAEEHDLEFRAYGGLGTKSPNTMEYRVIKDALSIGDLETAKKFRNELLEGKTGRERQKLLQSIRGSVYSSKPIRAFGLTSEAKQNEFKRWLKRRDPEGAASILEINNTYERSAGILLGK